MRLFTHNLLRSNIKGVTNGYPLGIEVVTLEEREEEFNAEFIRNIIPKINWSVLVAAAATFRVRSLVVFVGRGRTAAFVVVRAVQTLSACQLFDDNQALCLAVG